VQKINLYGNAGRDEVRAALMRMLRQGFGALTPPVPIPA
jgi:hypothetical protein